MDKSAIYQIFNTVTWKVYVGSAVNAPRRWQGHRLRLNKGVHHCRHLQHAWNKCGADAFSFEVIEVVERKEDLIAREQVHLDAAFADSWVYNTSPTAGNTLGARHTTEARGNMSRARKGKLLSAEHRAKIGLAHIGLARSLEARANMSRARRLRQPPSTETREKMSRAQRLRQPWSAEARAKFSLAQKNSPLNAESVKKMHLASKGKPRSAEHCMNISLAGRGRRHSAESCAKMSLARKGKPHSAEHRANLALANANRWRRVKAA